MFGASSACLCVEFTFITLPLPSHYTLQQVGQLDGLLSEREEEVRTLRLQLGDQEGRLVALKARLEEREGEMAGLRARAEAAEAAAAGLRCVLHVCVGDV